MVTVTRHLLATLVAVLLGLSITAAQAPAVHTGPRLATPLDAEHGEAIDRARDLLHAYLDRVPGISVAVAKNGRIVWAEGFGWADIEQRVPARATTRFRVGSVAKPMTASLLALLYQEGVIDLDAPVQRYVPSFPEKEAPVTTRLLAGHLAGIRHYRGDEMLSSRHYDTVLEGLAIFQDDPLLFEPGTRYSYSSYGWNLISAVIEGATGKGFLDQMEARVFEPLGMRSTTADENRLIILDRSRPYEIGDDGRLSNSPYVDNSYKWAGGGFVSTAEDLVRFGIAHMEPGFLQAETLILWQTSQKTSDGEETGYGMGWNVGLDDKGRKVIGHGGGSVGGTTRLALYPEQGIVIATITNLSRGPALPVAEILELFSEP